MAPGEQSGLTTAEAFELLGNETRAEILRVLSEQRAGGLPPALSFSELRTQLETDARSSQFNYHLDRLVDTFVEDRTEGSGQMVEEFVAADEGYALRPTGTFLTRVVTAMSTPATSQPRVEPFEANIACHFCDNSLEAEYRNTIFRLQCPNCDHLYAYTLTPPGLVAGAPDESTLLDRAATYLRQKYTTFARGVCSLCANGAAPEIISPAELNWPGADRLTALIRRQCTHCGNMNYALLGTELLRDAELVSFCERRGLNVTETRLWELPFAITDRHTCVESEQPWEATLSVTVDDETMALRVDDTVSIVDRTVR